jgi:MFS family permease
VLSVFPREKVPVAVAVWGAVGALAAAVGPTLGALLVEWFGWRSVFFINVPVGAFTLLFWRDVLPESKEAARRPLPDPVGIALMAAGVALIALGIVQSGDWGWTSAATIGSIIGGLAVLGVFVVRTSRVANPALDLTLFRARSFRWANIATAAFTVAFTAMFFANVQFFTQVWHYGIVRAGLALAPGPLVVMALAPQMGKLAARIGQRTLLIVGGLVYAASGAWLLLTVDSEAAWVAHFLPASLLSGVAVAMVIPQLVSAAVQDLPPDEFGVGSAVNQSIRQLGSTFGVALTVALIGTPHAGDVMNRFHRVWWLLVACGVLTSLASTRLPRRRTVLARASENTASPVLVPIGVGE